MIKISNTFEVLKERKILYIFSKLASIFKVKIKKIYKEEYLRKNITVKVEP